MFYGKILIQSEAIRNDHKKYNYRDSYYYIEVIVPRD